MIKLLKIETNFIIIFFIFFVFLSQIQNNFKIDEYYNHFPTVLNIYEKGLIKTINSDSYKAANTPLPYLLSLIPFKVSGFSPDIKSLRLINSLIALLSLIVIYFLIKDIDQKFSALYLVFFYPYFLKPAFTYYMAIYGLLFFFITILLIKNQNESRLKWFWIGLSVAAAVLSQQFYLILIPSVLIYILYYYDNNIKKIALTGLIFLIPSLSLTLPIFILWNGLTHPNYSLHQVKPDFSNLTSILLVSGGILIFYFASIVKYLDKKIYLIFLIISFFLNVFFYPEFSIKGGYEKITGYSFHFINIVEKFNYYVSFLLRFLLVSVGLYGIYSLLKIMYNKKELFFLILVIMLIAGFTFNVYLAERHLLPLAFLLIIYSSININSERLLKLWYSFQVIFGSIYFIYYLYYQPNYWGIIFRN